MKVLDAVDVVGCVHRERDAVQAAVTHHAGEAVRVVGFPRSPQDALHDGLTADGAGLQGVLQTQTHKHRHPHHYTTNLMMNEGILMIHSQRPFQHLFTISTRLLTNSNQSDIFGEVFLQFVILNMVLPVLHFPSVPVRQINPH